MISPSACQQWPPDRAADPAQQCRSYTTAWDMIASDAVAEERTRLTAVLDQATQEAAYHFQAALDGAFKSGEPQLASVAANDAATAITSIIERELRKTERIFGDIETAFINQAVAISPVSGPGIPLPGDATSNDAATGGRFRFADAATLLSPALNQLDREAIVGGFMAAKQAFPAAFKGLGPAFFGRVVPFIGPAIQTATGIYDAYSAHREAKREFEREKDRRLALAQQVADAGRKMRWALSQQCQGVIESIFGPVEDTLARQAIALKGEFARLEADRALLLKCKGRLEIGLEE
jgi:hypothetical protein